MKSAKIKKMIKKINITPDSHMVQKTLEDMFAAQERTKKNTSTYTLPNIRRMIMNTKTMKLTSSVAVVIFVVIGLLIFLGHSDSLYAQVKNAFEKADSVHVVITEFKQESWLKEHQVWYMANEGVREEERYEDQLYIRIDDKQYEWRYAADDKIASKIPSYLPQDEWTNVIYNWLRFDQTRIPSGDTIIRGIPCKMYTLSMPNESTKVDVWVDKNNRMLRYEKKREQPNGQVIRSIANFEFDKDFERNLFIPDFGKGVRIVSPRELIEERFPLNTAIFKQESLGFVFAVHRLDRGNGFVYLICSTRLSEKLRDEIGNDHPWTYYGGFNLIQDWNDQSDIPNLLARMKHGGIQVDWYMLVKPKNQTIEMSSCNIDVHLNAANQLAEKLSSQGLPIREKFRLNLMSAEPEERFLSLEDITREVFSFGKKVDPLVHSFLLTKVSNRKLIWKRPGIELTREDYLKNCEELLQHNYD